jgi:GAF domain-containing protein
MAANLTEIHELRALREENNTLYRVIRLVSSSLELDSMLRGIVELATEATGCHACFIYLLEGEQLTIRAASPVFAHAVGQVRFSVHEGLTGWVARHRKAEFIRDHAMDDPRMKYVPLLDEEHFQSMLAVPILARAGDTIGVIVLHTQAPHEFEEDTLKLLEHIASLVSGALENAQLYQRERRRVNTLTRLSALAQEVSAATERTALGQLVAKGARQLLEAEVCQLFLLGADESELRLLGSSPESAPALASRSGAALLLGALDARHGGGAKALWPELTASELLLAALKVGDERLGVLCAGSRAGASFSEEDSEVARALAHLTALAIKRVELIEELTTANAVKDMFEALASGASAFAAAKALQLRCPLSGPYVIACVEPEQSASAVGWQERAEELARGLAELTSRSAVEVGPGPLRAVLSLPSASQQAVEQLLGRMRDLGRSLGAAIGVSERSGTPERGPVALREATDAATIGRALLPDGGAITYAELGIYRYLVQIPPEKAPHDRMRAAVEALMEYDRRRHTALLDTLERYLSERRGVIDSARSLFIHPNTLRQRLGRIEELTGLDLEHDDLLSLQLAIKLVRLHSQPRAPLPA